MNGEQLLITINDLILSNNLVDLFIVQSIPYYCTNTNLINIF